MAIITPRDCGFNVTSGKITEATVELPECATSGWFETFTGRKFSILDPQPEDICIHDIAHALALTCRYGGQCKHFYSVAQHSILVAEKCKEENQLWGLMHDAAEAYIGDMPKPFKPFMANFDEIEEKIIAVIADKFGLPMPMPTQVHTIDRKMLVTEAAVLLPGCSWVEDYKPSVTKYNDVQIHVLGPEQSEQAFHNVFSQLYFR